MGNGIEENISNLNELDTLKSTPDRKEAMLWSRFKGSRYPGRDRVVQGLNASSEGRFRCDF